MDYRAVSLFAGCGGLDLGFHQSGVELVYACDNDQAAVDCYNHNFPSQAFKVDVTSEKFQNDLEKLENIDIVLGGFPCQGFSKSGPKKKEDPRNLLYKSMVSTVKKLKPKVFVAENVDGMAQNYKGEYLKAITSDFEEIGYNVESRILNAINYGVPQFRRRIIFIGIREDLVNQQFEWPRISHTGGARNGEFKTSWEISNQISLFEGPRGKLLDSVSISDAIDDLIEIYSGVPDHEYAEPKENQKIIIQNIKEGQKLCNVRFSDTSVYTWQIPEVFGEVNLREINILETIAKNRRKKKYGDRPNGNPLDIDTVCSISGVKYSVEEFQALEEKNYLKEVDGKYDLKGAMFCSGLYKRPNWNAPSPTIITVFDNPRFFVHPFENRPFSIRECARLQSFPDEFEFLSAGITLKDSYRLIGNAVPPLLAKNLAKSVMSFLDISRNEVKKSESKYKLRREISRI